ncbi:unnamed protein product [Blepharisma stoltei]|uniref:PX domain-containing protein n=1 Tax=Blepharisma stoltei TaxID=1481888 RepID=A0AAU9JT41_9CILI|nr:unnamed protein product [Blepharisma stoltei]
MNHNISINITGTYQRRKRSFLSRLYTEYEINTILDGKDSYRVFRRYKEFSSLNSEIEEILAENAITLPKFPKKIFNKLSAAVISERRANLELWLQEASGHTELLLPLSKFLNVPTDGFEIVSTNRQNSVSQDENLIVEFSTKVTSESRNRYRALEEFEWQFFSKRRLVRNEYFAILLNVLIPLCGLDNIGCKALDILTKLISSDRFWDFNKVKQELVKLGPDFLSKMKLNDHLMRRIHGESQCLAYEILKVLDENFQLAKDNFGLNIVLNNDLEALEAFDEWGSEKTICKSLPKILSHGSLDWRRLKCNERDSEIFYRLINKELAIKCEVNLETTVQRLISIITVPEERKKWDNKLIEMSKFELPEGQAGYHFLYNYEHTMYELNSIYTIRETDDYTLVQFKHTSSYTFNMAAINGIVESSYLIEKMENSESLLKEDSEEILEPVNKVEKLKLTWSSHFCDRCSKMFLSDLVDESDNYRQSIHQFIVAAEKREEKTNRTRINSMAAALERKQLAKRQAPLSLFNLDRSSSNVA